MNWPRAHWLTGMLALVSFLAAGAYMRYVALVPQMEAAPRMVFRSRFLFLLLAAVANIALAGVPRPSVLQRAASCLILAAPFPLMVSFFIDAGRGVESSPFTVWTMRGLFAAALLLAIANRPRSARSPLD